MRRHWRRSAIALVVIGLVAAACSSTKSTTTTTSTSAGGTGLVANQGNASGGPLADLSNGSPLTGPKGTGLTRGVTSSSITVGCVVLAAGFAGFEQGLQARFARANKTGIDGRKINLLPCKDDAGSEQTDVQETQQLVNQNNVFALFSATQAIGTGSTNFLNNNQVPFFGWGFLPGFCGLRWGFGWNGCLEGNAATKAQVAHAAIQGNLAEAMIKASGMSASQVRFAVLGNANAAGQIGNTQYNSLFKALGAKVVYDEANFPVTAGADVTPFVQAIMATNPNIVYLSTLFSSVGPLAEGLKAAGYKGAVMDFQTYIPGLLQASPQLSSALQGEYINSQIVPDEENTAWIRQEEADLSAIGQPPFVTLGGAIGYAEAEEFVEMIQAVGSTLNTSTFDKKINGGGFTSFTNISGGPGELQWPAAHLLPADCAAILKVSGNNFQVVEPFKCYQSYKVF